MRIVCLVENTSSNPQVHAEHGLSLYIEACEKRILFDTGQTDALLGNARAVGVDLASVDLTVISHGHYDHGGGIGAFLGINGHAPVYISERAFGDYRNRHGRYIGLDRALTASGRLVRTGDRTTIAPGIELRTCNELPRRYPAPDDGMTDGSTGEPDRFLHEQYLVLTEGENRVVLSGCSHKGVLNIVDWLAPDVFVGGFHLMHEEVDPASPTLVAVADALTNSRVAYHTCHCTGAAQYGYLKARLGGRLGYLHAGDDLTV